jgi:hypothetical protein
MHDSEPSDDEVIDRVMETLAENQEARQAEFPGAPAITRDQVAESVRYMRALNDLGPAAADLEIDGFERRWEIWERFLIPHMTDEDDNSWEGIIGRMSPEELAELKSHLGDRTLAEALELRVRPTDS